MFKILLFISLILYHVNCLNDCSYNIEQYEILNITLDLQISKILPIEYKKQTNFIFKIEDENTDTYRVNIHSIDCNIEIDFKGETISQKNIDTYSLRVNAINKTILVKPLIDKVDGIEKENYDQKICHIIINSINENQPEINIENNENTIFYFEKDEILNISYEKKGISNDSFVALLFQFNEKCNFSININNIKSEYIYNSTFIYLKSDILKTITDNILNIKIEKLDKNKSVYMFFKIIKKESISMIKKGALNYGFITTKLDYQYYYLEVYNDEEGELLLHNKRFYGELLAKIIPKDEKTDLFDTSIYPKEDETYSNMLNYNPHSLKLIYNYSHTLNCINGCYILITYRQIKSEKEMPAIGYEFTILSRSWNYSDYISQIVEIPFNEYLIGSFEKKSIANHYYFLTIPDDAEKLIIQMEGNYIDFFVGEGKKRINTMKDSGNDKKYSIINNQNVIILNITELNFKRNEISFALRSKDYFDDIFSFYYFRILYVKKDEIIYYPIDSQFGNLCLPEKNNQEKYYCNLIFSNKYDELSTNFSVSSSNLDEYFKIYVNKIDKKNNKTEDKGELFYKYNDTNDIDYFVFTFEFEKGEVENIISTLQESIKHYYPQIYSSQMFHIYNFSKECLYKVENNYTLIFKYINGINKPNAYTYVSFLDFTSIYSNRNFRGKSLVFDINSNTTNVTHRNEVEDLIFVISLEYNMRNKGAIEIKSGEARSQIMKTGYFPLYYFLKIKNSEYINLDVNLRLNSYDDSVMKNNFDIKGYLLDDDAMKRKINGEFIKLSDPISGNYSDKFKVGLIKINKQKDNKNINYLLIEIENKNSDIIESCFLVEIVAKEYYQEYYQNGYFMPINTYMIETFNDKNGKIRSENEYHIFVNQKEDSQVNIELSPEFNSIDLIFINKTTSENYSWYDFNCILNKETGFKKYKIYEINDYNIFFKVINKEKKISNYMIRYYYGNENDSFTYILNNIIAKEDLDTNNEIKAKVNLTFEPIKIKKQSRLLDEDIQIYFYVSGLLFKKNESSNELINTTSFLYERKPMFEAKTVSLYNSKHPQAFSLIFEDIPRNNNDIYDLQLQINVFIKKNLFNEEFLIFNFEVDLTDIEKKKSILWYILIPIIVIIVLLIIIVVVIIFIRLKRKNNNLEEDLKSFAYSNDIQKNVIIKEQKEMSKKDMDYESTFI